MKLAFVTLALALLSMSAFAEDLVKPASVCEQKALEASRSVAEAYAGTGPFDLVGIELDAATNVMTLEFSDTEESADVKIKILSGTRAGDCRLSKPHAVDAGT